MSELFGAESFFVDQAYTDTATKLLVTPDSGMCVNILSIKTVGYAKTADAEIIFQWFNADDTGGDSASQGTKYGVTGSEDSWVVYGINVGVPDTTAYTVTKIDDLKTYSIGAKVGNTNNYLRLWMKAEDGGMVDPAAATDVEVRVTIVYDLYKRPQP